MTMTTRHLALGTMAMIGARVATILLSLVVTPVLFRNLGRPELGLWFLFAQGTSLLSLFDLGLQTVLGRRIALRPPGSGADALAEDIAAVRFAMRWLSALLLGAGTAAGWWLLPGMTNGATTASGEILGAWSIMCVAYAVGMWGGHWSSLLQGRGLIAVDTLIALGTTVVASSAQCLLVARGHGLLALAIATAIAAILGRIAAWAAAIRLVDDVRLLRPAWNRPRMSEILAPATKIWITTLGSFLILKTDQFFIATCISPAEIPPYQAAYQIVANLYAFAGSFAAASTAFVSSAWSRGDVPGAAAIVRRNLSIALPIMACGAACLLSAGEDLLSAWIGPGNFVGYPILGIFCAMLTLEAHHKTFEYAVRATGPEPFAWWYIASGVLNLVVTWVLVQRLGLIGVALGTLVAQLLTLNWYAVLRGLRTFAIPIGTHLRTCAAPAAASFVAAALISHAALALLDPARGDLLRLAVSCAVCGSTLAATLGLALPRVKVLTR